MQDGGFQLPCSPQCRLFNSCYSTSSQKVLDGCVRRIAQMKLSPSWSRSVYLQNPQSAGSLTQTKYHAAGDANDRFVLSEFYEIQETLRLEKINAKTGWINFLKTPGNRKRLLLIFLVAFFSQCSGNGLISYYLHSILDSVGITSSYDQTIINGCLTIWSLIVSCVACMFVDKVGRRPLFISAAVGMLVVFTIWTACSAVYSRTGSTSAGSAVVAMIFLFNGAIGVAYPGLTVAYPVEIIPFNLRAKGIAILYACKALASTFNQYGIFVLNSNLLQNLDVLTLRNSESYWSAASHLEVLFCVHRHTRARMFCRLVSLCGDKGSYA